MKRKDFFKKSILGAIAIWKAPEILAKKPRFKKYESDNPLQIRSVNHGDVLFHKQLDECFYVIGGSYLGNHTLIRIKHPSQTYSISYSELVRNFVKIGSRQDISYETTTNG